MKFAIWFAAGLFLSSAVFAMPARPDAAPVKRLIDNTEKFIKAHPRDPSGYAILARIHSMAFIYKTEDLNYFGRNNGLPSLSQFQQPAPKPTGDDALLAHFKASIANYQKAIAVDPKYAIAEIGLAFMQDHVGDFAPKLADPDNLDARPAETKAEGRCEQLIAQLADADASVRDKASAELVGFASAAIFPLKKHADDASPAIRDGVRKALQSIWTNAAEAHYLAAFDLTVEKDAQAKSKPMWGLQELISYDAAQNYLRILKDKSPSKEESKQADRMAAHIKAMDNLPMGPVSPIIFNLDAPKTLAALSDGSHFVNFDLDGLGRRLQWSWVQPDTALLVWDPARAGKITSGRQLFGNFSFGLLLEDGYRALDLLDDNRDGLLSGDELKGLAIWRDENSNGISDPGEVIPIESTSIRQIATRAGALSLDGPSAPAGLTLQSGALLPTYDWLSTPRRPQTR